MPRKDEIHEAVKNALVKDGWTITDDPFRIVFEDADVYIDLRIVKPCEGTVVQRALVIEIKGFREESPIHSLEVALGQLELYRILLRRSAPEEKLYVAISATTYDEQFLRPSFDMIMKEKKLPLVVVDTDTEEIVQWIN